MQEALRMPGRDKKALPLTRGEAPNVLYLQLCRHLQRLAKYTCTLMRGLV